jgi:hypothetical protein
VTVLVTELENPVACTAINRSPAAMFFPEIVSVSDVARAEVPPVTVLMREIDTYAIPLMRLAT